METGLLINVILLISIAVFAVYYFYNTDRDSPENNLKCEKCSSAELHFQEMYTTCPAINSPCYTIYRCNKCGNKIYKRMMD